MAQSPTSKQLYEFGPFRIDPVERLLLRAGQSVSLTPKAFDTLLVLVQNTGRVLEKDELMKAVWPDSFVEEVNLAHNISILRKTLGELSGEQRYIETVPRRGYRFVANVARVREESAELVLDLTRSHMIVEEEEVTSAEVEAAPGAKTRAGTRITAKAMIVWAVIIALVGSAAYLWTRARPNSRATASIRSIAVLPFKPLASDSHDESLEIGMADTLITRLSTVKQLVVRPTSAVRKYTSLDQDPVAAGLELKVDSVLDGSLQRSGDRIRVTVRLVRAADGSLLWTDKFDEKFADIFGLQDRVSERVAAALALTVTGEERRQLIKHHTENTEAYSLYLKGRYFWSQRTEGGLKKSIDYFEQAVEKDGSYALAHSGFADAYTTLGYFSYLAPKDCFPKARAAAAKALELDPSLAEPHTSLAYARLYYDWDWAGAEAEFKRAIALNPNYPTAHHWYSVYLTVMERWDEALAEIHKAHELDPLSLIINTDIGFELYYAGRYDEGIAQLRTTLEMNRDFPLAHLWLGRAYQQKGMYQAAIGEFRRAESVLRNWVVPIAAIGHVHGEMGNRGEALRVLDQLKTLSKEAYVTPYGVALVYAALGDKEQAFAWLDRALQDRSHWLVWTKLDPRWGRMRSDPRFAGLLKGVGLSQ